MLEQRVGKGGMATHLVQIVNQPHQILVLEFWNGFFIPFPVEDVA